MNAVRFLAIAFAGLSLLLTVAPGCGGDDAPEAFKGASSGTSGKDGGASSGTSGGNDTICLQNNCDKDRDCANCEGGATSCLQKEHRCIACGAEVGNKACAGGQTCTKYGACVGDSVKCAEDAAGVPTITTCKNNADCGACGPKFRVCDTGSGKCVGCSPGPNGNTTNCQSTDTCSPAGACVAKCPSTCTTDAECGLCAKEGTKPAAACNNHVCAQCSATVPCPNGDKCDVVHGTCVKQCGTGTTAGVSSCTEKGNCSSCTGTTECKIPVGGGGGVCATQAVGCEDLGKGTIVLPDPFSRVTQTCSTDANCAGQSLDINVGKLLRDATGLSFIKDGNIPYSLNACASVEVFDKTCGVCVPCKIDTDCTDIDIDKTAGDLFGPVGSIASALLLDKAFGPSDHKVHMYCQNVAGNYGVCAPCGNILGRCAQTAKTDVPATGKCDHPICELGTALNTSCETAGSTCISDVCTKDPYCCDKEWDFKCKQEVDQFCQDTTCQPDSCAFRKAGWYCLTDPGKGGYRCGGDGGSPSTLEGQPCATGTECRTEKKGPKEPALLCKSETDPGCGPNAVGRPQCFTK